MEGVCTDMSVEIRFVESVNCALVWVLSKRKIRRWLVVKYYEIGRWHFECAAGPFGSFFLEEDGCNISIPWLLGKTRRSC